MESKSWMIYSTILIFLRTIVAECPENGSCGACELLMSISLESVDNIIKAALQEDIEFTLRFQQREHSGITFLINGVVFDPITRNPDFPCTSEMDAPRVTQALKVQFYCTVVKPGSYRINASVDYCDREYSTQIFTVVVENDLPASLPSSPSSPSVSTSLTSPVLIPSMSSSLALSSVPSTRPSVPSLSVAVAPSTLSSRVLPSTSTSVLPSSTTENDVKEINSFTHDTMIAVITCTLIGLILIGVIVIIIILLKCPKARPNNVCHCWSDQPAPDPPGHHHLQQETLYHSTSVISEASNEATGSYVAPSDFSTPVDSVSLSFVHPEQVEMSENVTQDPDEAITSHQLGINYTN